MNIQQIYEVSSVFIIFNFDYIHFVVVCHLYSLISFDNFSIYVISIVYIIKIN